jgi:uncharacterized protein YqhQ
VPEDRAAPAVARVKVGGQALPDGVMMRTDRAWAVARADGSVRTGAVRAVPFARVPLLRVVTGLAQAIRLGLSTATGGLRRRSPGWPLIRSLILTEVSVIVFAWAASTAHLPLGGRWTSGMVVWAVAISVFRVSSPARQWRFHGAEHKAVTAYERDIPLDDTAAVLSCPRVHPRCGTNLVFWLAACTPVLARLPWPTQPFAFLAIVAVTAEMLTLAGQRPENQAAQVLLVPGSLLQWAVTTREPTADEQAIGCRALEACLARHHQPAPEAGAEADAVVVTLA